MTAEQLREALREADNDIEPRGTHYLVGYDVLEAAHSYLRILEEGRETAWCPSHHSVYLNPDVGCEAALAAQVKPWREPCVETWMRLTPIEEEDE